MNDPENQSMRSADPADPVSPRAGKPGRNPARWFSAPIIAVLILMIRLYQRSLSHLIGKSCRFTPSCSHYAIEALQKYGLIRGSLKSLYRIVRCNPFGQSGLDPP